MATSGTIGSASSSRPYLTIYWQRTSEDVANNRSRIKATLRLNAPSRVNFGGNKVGTLQGSSFTYSSGASGTGTWNLRTREFWVGHNSDGTKRLTLSGTFNINISYSGSWMGQLSVSDTVTLDAIPRNSELTSFSIANNLKTGTANSVSLGIKRNYSSYTHTIDLNYGNTNITSWSGVGVPASLSLTDSEVNKILNTATTTTSPRLTLRMSTRDSSNRVIGQVVSRNYTSTIDSSVRPSISGFSIGISGSGRDKTINKYVRNITRVTSSFSSSAGYGATVSLNSISVKSDDGVETLAIPGESGTTRTSISRSGGYKVIASVRDSRGRENTSTLTFTALDYYNPSISKFDVSRKSSDGTIGITSASGSWAPVGNQNSLTATLERRLRGSTSWSSVGSKTYTTGTFTMDMEAPNTAEASSYDFRVRVRDQFGKESIAEVLIGTAKTVFDVHKNLGVGIGKRHERGELDVAGDVYYEGNIELKPKLESGRPGFKMISQDPSGHGYIEFYGPDNTRRAYIGIPNRTDTRLNIYNEQDDLVNFWGSDVAFANNPIVSSGQNSNGNWAKFYDGTAITWSYFEGTANTGNTTVRFDLPLTLSGGSFVGTLRTMAIAYSRMNLARIINAGNSQVNVSIVSEANSSFGVWVFGLGRW